MFCVFELLLVLVLFTEMCLWQVSQSWLFIVEISHLGNVWREVSMCRESNLIILVLRVRLSRHLSLWAAATATLPRQKAWERIANAVANALQASLKVEILKVFYCWKSESWKSVKERQMLLPTPCWEICFLHDHQIGWQFWKVTDCNYFLKIPPGPRPNKKLHNL